jgi:hypothetical protein
MRKMRKIILSIFLVILVKLVLGQDVIVKTDGEVIKAKVTEVSINEIKFHKLENLEGPIFSILKSDVYMIKFENGTTEVFKNEASFQKTRSNSNSSSQFRFGLKVGCDFAYGRMKNYNTDFDRVPGFKMPFGFLIEYNLKNEKISFESGLLYTPKGASLSRSVTGNLQTMISSSDVTVTQTLSFNPHYIELPISAIYKINIKDNKKNIFFMNAGFYIDYGIGGTFNIDYSTKNEPLGYTQSQVLDMLNLDDSSEDIIFPDDVNRMDYGLNLGIGIEAEKIQYRIQYSLGFTNIFNSKNTAIESFNRVISFNFAYMFGK